MTTCAKCKRAVFPEHVNADGLCVLCAGETTSPQSISTQDMPEVTDDVNLEWKGDPDGGR